MKKICFYLSASLLLFKVAFIASCTGQSISKTGTQISEYVVEIFEDSKGNLWFGTMSDGVARYDGKTLAYFSTKDGLAGSTVPSIAEDKEGSIWLGTHSGLSRFDGKTFTNFTRKEGLCNVRVSKVLIDKTGNIWVGTWGGVCRLDGTTFSEFPLPVPDVETPDYVATKNWVSEIMEDQHGNIWFGRSGYGACKYDTATGAFTQFTKKDGLPSDCVQAITEDRHGNIWFGCRVAERDNPDPEARTGDGGLCRYDPSADGASGKSFVQYPELEGLNKNDIYTIYEDKNGNIWIGATGYGAYRYDGSNFTVIKETDRMDLTRGFGLQAAVEDRNGTLWFGFSGGLFRLEGSSITNVTQEGPWK